jgi:uncharacterized Rmd1/YagE family protein
MFQKNPKTIKERLAIVETKIDEIQKRLDEFIDNEFHRLQNRVDWILWFLILGTLISIALSFLK